MIYQSVGSSSRSFSQSSQVFDHSVKPFLHLHRPLRFTLISRSRETTAKQPHLSGSAPVPPGATASYCYHVARSLKFKEARGQWGSTMALGQGSSTLVVAKVQSQCFGFLVSNSSPRPRFVFLISYSPTNGKIRYFWAPRPLRVVRLCFCLVFHQKDPRCSSIRAVAQLEPRKEPTNVRPLVSSTGSQDCAGKEDTTRKRVF